MSLTGNTRKWLKRHADISLRGKTAVVTGANSGVGFKTAETLLYLGADVILACRNPQRAHAARAALAAEYPGSAVSVMPLDLADFASIDAFVDRIRQEGRDIDVFVNNAGVLHAPGQHTRDGFDLVMGTNYFGVYRLTERLLPYLATLPHEVTYVNTVSMICRLSCTREPRLLRVYARSKQCLAKYTYYKAGQLENGNVRIYMNHPGITLTPMGLNLVGPRISGLARRLTPLFNSPEKSSLSVAYILAHRPPAGSLVGPVKGFGGWGYPQVNRPFRGLCTGVASLIAFTEKEMGRGACSKDC